MKTRAAAETAALEQTITMLRQQLQQAQYELEAERVVSGLREARLRAVIDTQPECIKTVSVDGRLMDMNPAGLRLLDADNGADLIGRAVSELVHPDDRDAYIRMHEAASRGAAAELRFRIISFKGRERWIESHATPLREANGSVSAVLSVTRDVTSAARAQELEAQLLHSQKMESIGRLAGGVAHDFNNMLTVMLGALDLWLAAGNESNPLFSEMEEARHAGLRASALTRQLLAFSRRQTLHPTLLDLNTVVEHVFGMLRRLIGEHIEIDFHPAAQIGRVRADPGQLDQVLLNITVNARDAMPDGGTLTITTANATFDAAEGAAHDVPPGDYVVLTLADTGVGMDEETRLQVFEPFFTTKEAGQGTGLGLSTVYGIVQQSGGGIRVESEPGRGSRFSIALPRVAATAP